MAVYLGSSGYVTLQRTAEGRFRSIIDPGDINITSRRFSFDFPAGTFITGDHLVIQRVQADGSPSTQPLDFIDASGWAAGSVQPDGSWYAHVDPIGGIRLYRTWAESLTGTQKAAVQLATPGGSYPIAVSVQGKEPRSLAQVNQFTLTTERSALDISSLGDTYVQQISGLISGGGTLECYWDWAPAICGDADLEYAQYLHQLILRQQVGSEFSAELILKRRGVGPIDSDLDAAAARVALMYSITGIVTNVGIAVAPDQPLISSIDFVTTGDIRLRYDVPAGDLILQENADRIFLEDATGYLAQDFEG